MSDKRNHGPRHGRSFRRRAGDPSDEGSVRTAHVSTRADSPGGRTRSASTRNRAARDGPARRAACPARFASGRLPAGGGLLTNNAAIIA